MAVSLTHGVGGRALFSYLNFGRSVLFCIEIILIFAVLPSEQFLSTPKSATTVLVAKSKKTGSTASTSAAVLEYSSAKY